MTNETRLDAIDRALQIATIINPDRTIDDVTNQVIDAAREIESYLLDGATEESTDVSD